MLVTYFYETCSNGIFFLLELYYLNPEYTEPEKIDVLIYNSYILLTIHRYEIVAVTVLWPATGLTCCNA